MYPRPFWLSRIHRAWEKRSVVWLSGVRRVGKTTLARMLAAATYMNCDLPSVCRVLAEPEAFLDSLSEGTVVIFDEIQRLDDPSRLLKIAADAYPGLRVLATGSSTLAATRKFRDSLTGRKTSIHLPPVLWEECLGPFAISDLDRRLLRGGLPEPLLSQEYDPSFFAEWCDSFYARDVQELFGIRNRVGFLKLFSLLTRQSGGQLDYSRLASLSDLSRPTVKAHVEAMSIAHVACLLTPFHGHGRREITRMPRCYVFDTGFVCFQRGWETVREDDRGYLWEHLVLDAIRSAKPTRELHFWRDKSGREVDFVCRGRGDRVTAIECKIAPDRFDPGNLVVFRSLYPAGANYVVSPWVKTAYQRHWGDLKVTFLGIADLRQSVADVPLPRRGFRS